MNLRLLQINMLEDSVVFLTLPEIPSHDASGVLISKKDNFSKVLSADYLTGT